MERGGSTFLVLCLALPASQPLRECWRPQARIEAGCLTALHPHPLTANKVSMAGGGGGGLRGVVKAYFPDPVAPVT